MTERIHGAETAASVAAAASVLFGDFDPQGAAPQVFDVLAQEVPTASLERGDNVALVDAVVHAGLAKSKSEARRTIEQGGIYVNQRREDNIDRKLESRDWLAGRNVLLRKGKKDYALLRLGS